MPSELIRTYLRNERLPHIWCPGCGNGTLVRDVAVALDELYKDPSSGITREKTVIVSGIGCSSRAAGYFDFDTIHTTHGRAIAFATGIKMADPSLHVIVLTGDGDCSAIGGNHLIHACRRNMGLAVIVFNNNIYGMTGGQYSPTTPYGDFATTAPYGVIDPPFDIAALSIGAGATYVARGDTFHVKETVAMIKGAVRHAGFSLVDCYTVCPTYYGRKNKKGSAVKMVLDQKERGIPLAAYERLSEEEKKGKYAIGVLKDVDRPEYTAEYDKIIERAGGHHGQI